VGIFGTIKISGGTVSAKSSFAVCAVSSSGNVTGTITVSGTAKVTSANTGTTSGTIVIGEGSATTTRLEITGGTVENTSATTGNAIYNDYPGAVIISGGTVSKAGDGNYAVYNNGTGTVTIGDGATIVGNISL
jgi:hypothetical protein